ncbi:MAG: rRNA maturation RNase YbeY [Chitinophagaceae bacterium]|nr:rRNA maturation RNase YbeY [Chitinophagaceae bacterium]
MPKVYFHAADATIPLKGRTAVKSFIETIFKKERTALGSISYIFCADSYLLQINQDFLSHDYYTDIITFNLAEPGHPVEAEIYISVDRVRDNAANLGQSYRSELLRVVFHGALHLCGYRDKKKSEITIMRQKEDQYLRLFEKNN